MNVIVEHYVERWSASPFAGLAGPPWRVTDRAQALVSAAILTLASDYRIADAVAIHRTATVESGAVVKGPAIVGPGCFVAASAYLRGGTFLDEDCIIGPGAELKTSFMFKGSKLAHFNFVGDSILGGAVNLEAGAIVANYRNELEDKAISFVLDGQVIETGAEKFGALLGDGVRVGANAVIAPGAVVGKGARVPRLSLLDQHPTPGR